LIKSQQGYNILTQTEQHNISIYSKKNWNKAILLKVPLFAWRNFKRRISAKDKLIWRRMVLLVLWFVQEVVENMSQLIFYFSVVISLAVFDILFFGRWVFTLYPQLTFVSMHNNLAVRKCSTGIFVGWMTCIWIIWNEPNARIFFKQIA